MGQKSIILAVALIIFTIILMIVFVFSRIRANDSPKNAENETTEQIALRNVVPVADIINDPEVYEGYSLEVDAEISNWATNRSFFFTETIGGGGLGGGTRKSLLVIAPQPFQLPQESTDDAVGLGEIARVTAKGTVQILNKEQLEAALGIDLENPKETLYDTSIKKWTLGPALMLSDLQIDNTVRN